MAGKFKKKSNKLKIKKLQINFTDKWFYTFVVVISLIAIGVGVFAITPNPGHDITQIAPPSGCDNEQFLKWTRSTWTCADAGGVETDPVWTGDSTNVAFINKANAFGAFNQIFDTNVLFVDATNNRVGIGTTSPEYKLDVNGNVKANVFIGDGSGLTDIFPRITDATGDCKTETHGLLRYRSGLCSGDNARSSYFDICMKTGDTTYQWKILKTSTWTDTECGGTEGCPSGQQWYECEGRLLCADPGCYDSEPERCWPGECFDF